MKRLFFLITSLLVSGMALFGAQDKLRVFIRAGEKTHGPGKHDSPRFLKEWTDLLNSRGASAQGAMTFPTEEQLAATDVLIIHCVHGGWLNTADRSHLNRFISRGGGVVVLHDAISSNEPEWFKTVVGGSWDDRTSKFYEGLVSYKYLDHQHPITKGAADFQLNDEMYYQLVLAPEAHVLAAVPPPSKRMAEATAPGQMYPQMWVYEKPMQGVSARTFVCLLGHEYATFNLPQVRAVLLRGIAWTGKRDIDSLCSADDLASLAHPQNATAASAGPTEPVKLGKDILDLFSRQPDAAAALTIASTFSSSEPEIQKQIVDELARRGEWTSSLLNEIAATKPANGRILVNSLRMHPSKAVAKRAIELTAELRGPEAKEKAELLAKYAPVADEIGNVGFGRQLFLPNCGGCHSFKAEGRALVSDLTGIGVLGSQRLVVDVLDPSRMVDAQHMTTAIETKNGERYEGIVTHEDKSSIFLRNPITAIEAHEVQIAKADVKTRQLTGRSLMPEGFEGIGPAAVRDILDYVGSVDGKYRVIDMRSLFTAALPVVSSNSAAYGIVKIAGIPFEVADPSRTPTANNLLVLNGQTETAKPMPQKVEIPVNLKAYKLHFLALAPGSASADSALPPTKVTVSYTNGRSETFSTAEVESHSAAETNGALSGLQIRYFTRPLADSQTRVQKITVDGSTATAQFIGITAEIEPKRRVVETIEDLGTFFPHTFGPIRVSMLGGGTGHDFSEHFNVPDSVTMVYASESSMNYTTNLENFNKSIPENDVLYICSNQPMTNDALRKNMFTFANRGGGFLLIHDATAYIWKDWPEYNRELVGGGASDQEKYGPVEVTIMNRKHPIMEYIPKSFTVKDELYRFKPDPKGTPVEVLATGKNLATGATFPVVWIVKHPKAKIVCISLGHDMDTHNNVAYRVMLQNAMAWVAGRKPENAEQ